MSTRTMPPAPMPRFVECAACLTPAETARLPALPGSELRGLLLRGLTRIGRLRDGDPTPFTLTPRWLGDGPLGDGLPADHPIDWPAGQPIAVRILWFGADPDPRAVIEAGFAAIGWEPLLGRAPHRARFAARVEAVRDHDAITEAIEARCVALADAPALTLRTVTPLALRIRGVMADDFGDGTPLLISVRHRAARLARAFAVADAPPIPIEHGPLAVLADETRPMRYRRFGRQGRPTPMATIHGAVRITRPTPAALRALVVGEALRAGRWTAFGAGCYAIEADHTA